MKIKHLFFVLLLFMLVGCGARFDYEIDINTNNETIKLNITMNIDENDYEYIKGGRKKIISIINNSIPKYMKYSISETNSNKFVFQINFQNYDDYKEIYKKVSGVDSKSIFEEPKTTNKTPFHLHQHIEMKDDLSVFMKWLKDAIIKANIVSKENQSNLIESQNFTYKFNEKYTAMSDEHIFEDEVEIQLKDIRVNAIISKGQLLDVDISFLINEKFENKFAENFNNYLKTKEINYELKTESIVWEEETYICKTISLKKIDLNNEKDLMKLNKLFGEEFAEIIYTNEDVSDFFKKKSQQNIHITLNFRKLFELEQSKNAEVTIDLVDTHINKESYPNNMVEMPYKTVVEDNERFDISLYTTVENYKFTSIILTILIVAVLLVLSYKFIYKRLIENIFDIRNIELFIKRLFFVKDINIKNMIIEENQSFIKIKNISKIDMDYILRTDMLKLCLALWIVFIVLLNIDQMFLAIVVFFIAMILVYVNIILYKTLTIEIELSSGKKYYLTLDENDKTRKLYLDLLKHINEDKNINK